MKIARLPPEAGTRLELLPSTTWGTRRAMYRMVLGCVQRGPETKKLIPILVHLCVGADVEEDCGVVGEFSIDNSNVAGD